MISNHSALANSPSEDFAKCRIYFDERECIFQETKNYPYTQYSPYILKEGDVARNVTAAEYVLKCKQHFSPAYCAEQTKELNTSKLHEYMQTESARNSGAIPFDTAGGTVGTSDQAPPAAQQSTTSANTEAQTPQARYYEPDTSQYDNLKQRFEKECKPKLELATRCCRNPEQCLGESVGADGSQNSLILGALQTILGAAGQAANISGACGKMKNVALLTSGINAALATKCTAKIYQCKDACKEVREEAKQMLAACEANNGKSCAGIPRPTPLSREPTVAETRTYDAQRNEHDRVSGIRSSLRDISSDENSCASNENYAQQQVNQTIASALTAQTMGLCKKASSSDPTTNPVTPNAFNVDCASPANASNPACQNMCNRAGAQNDPACNGGGGGLNFGDGRPSNLVNPNAKNGLGALDEFEAEQAAVGFDGASSGSKISSSSPGGSANLPGGNGGFGGGGAGAAGAGDEGSGLSPGSIGNSIRSGSGYINPQGRGLASAGGPQPVAGGPRGAGGKSFNPKDYLPGGPLDPKRKLAGLASSTPDIGAVHGDIFQSITNRFYQICLRNGLYDCATLRKSGTQGN